MITPVVASPATLRIISHNFSLHAKLEAAAAAKSDNMSKLQLCLLRSEF